MTATNDSDATGKKYRIQVERCPIAEGVEVLEYEDAMVVQLSSEYYRQMNEIKPDSQTITEYTATVLTNVLGLEE